MRHSTWEDDGGFGLAYEEPQAINTLQCHMDGEPAIAIFKGNGWTRESMIDYFKRNPIFDVTNFGEAVRIKDELGLMCIVRSKQNTQGR